MRGFFLLVASLVCLASCAQWATQDSEKAELHLRVGSSMLASGNYPQAMSELLAAEKLDDANPAIQNALALTYAARERYDLAEEHSRRSVHLKADYTEGKTTLARILIEEKKYPEADLILKESLQDLTYPNPEKIYMFQGLSFFRQQKWTNSRASLLKSIEMQQKNCLAQTLYGRTLFELKDYSAAGPSLDRAIGFCGTSDLDEPQYYSALAYYQLGEQRKAETRLEEIVKLYPNGRFRDRARAMLDTMRR